MGRFEAHITLAKEHRKIAEDLADEVRWTFSEITGCPILGQGTYCYLTGYDTDSKELLRRMNKIRQQLFMRGVEPLRMKIENIVYDTKTGVDNLSDSNGAER